MPYTKPRDRVLLRIPRLMVTSLVLAFLGCGEAMQAREAGDSSFTLSSSADDVILDLSSSGGYRELGASGGTRLFGDGRLVRTRRSGETERETQVVLTLVEMRELIAILVNGNLMNWMDESMKQRFRQELGGIPAHRDVGLSTIRVVLETFGQRRAVTKEIRYAFSIAMLRYTNPDMSLPEIDALEAFGKKIQGYLEEVEGGE